MSQTTLPRPAAAPSKRQARTDRFDQQTLIWAELFIDNRRCDTAALAKLMKVSRATASRVLAELRRTLARKGDELVTVRDSRGWFYEIRFGERTLRRRREVSKMAGFIKGGPPILRPGETVDDVLYPKTGKCP